MVTRRLEARPAGLVSVGDAIRSRRQDSTRGAPGRTSRKERRKEEWAGQLPPEHNVELTEAPASPGSEHSRTGKPAPPRSGLVHAAGGL